MNPARATLLLALLAVSAPALPGCAAAPAAGGDGWRELFDGRSLAGWNNPFDWGEAWVEDGEIHLRGDRKFFLMTDELFADFVFEGEVRLPDRESNSGFMFRAVVEPNRVAGYQAEVDPTDRRWSGGLYDEERRGWLHPVRGDSASEATFRDGPGQAFRPTDWNHYRIEARGDRFQIWVNDTLTTSYRDDLDRQGPLGLQHHGEPGKIYRFRNLRVRPLGRTR